MSPAGGGQGSCAVPAASPACWPAVRAVTDSGPQSEPVREVTMGSNRTGVQSKRTDVKSKASTALAAPRPPRRAGPAGAGRAGPGGPAGARRRRGAGAAAGALRGGGQGRQRAEAGVKITVPVGKICDTCKVKPAAYPDNNDWNCADCQFKGDS